MWLVMVMCRTALVTACAAHSFAAPFQIMSFTLIYRAQHFGHIEMWQCNQQQKEEKDYGSVYNL